jgi:hypothetical protein
MSFGDHFRQHPPLLIIVAILVAPENLLVQKSSESARKGAIPIREVRRGNTVESE